MKNVLLALSTAMFFSNVQAAEPVCTESIYNGVTQQGEVINFCLQDDGKFRYLRLKKDTDEPVVDVLVLPKEAEFINNDSDDITYKEFSFRKGKNAFRMMYQADKTGESAEVMEDAHSRIPISPDSLTTNIDSRLIELGVTPSQTEYD